MQRDRQYLELVIAFLHELAAQSSFSAPQLLLGSLGNSQPPPLLHAIALSAPVPDRLHHCQTICTTVTLSDICQTVCITVRLRAQLSDRLHHCQTVCTTVRLSASLSDCLHHCQTVCITVRLAGT